MASTSVSQNIPAPKKRTEALAITTYSLSKGITLLAAIVGYNLLIAVLLIALYPMMTQNNIEALLSSYLANSLMSGRLGAHTTTWRPGSASCSPALLLRCLLSHSPG